MVRRSRRKRSVKNRDKEKESVAEMSHTQEEMYQSPVRSTRNLNYVDNDYEIEMNEEIPCLQQSHSQFVAPSSMDQERSKSPLPHEVFKKSNSGQQIQVFNLSPHAVEKREKLKAKQDELEDLHQSGIMPKLLEMSDNIDVPKNVPLLLNKSLSEGCDPFECVRISLSNGIIPRDKVFSKIKISQEIRIGGNVNSNFCPFVKPKNSSERTASSSIDSNPNDCETARNKSLGYSSSNQDNDISQNSNMAKLNFKNGDKDVDQDLLDLLDSYPNHVLQKTAMILIERSLARSKSFELPSTFPQQL